MATNSTDNGSHHSASAQGDSSGSEVLLVLHRGDSAQIRLLRTRFKGDDYVDLRTWWRNAAGDWLPSRKGVSVRLEDVPRLRDALAAL